MDSESYVRFIFFLGSGLVGLCATLRVLLDSLLANWDLIGDLRNWWQHSVSHRHPAVGDWEWERTPLAEEEPAPLSPPFPPSIDSRYRIV